MRKTWPQGKRLLFQEQEFKKLEQTGDERISPVLANAQYDPLKPNTLYLSLKINNKGVKALLDSGAEVTLISKKLANNLNLRINTTENNIKFIAANKQTMMVRGWTIINLKLGQLKQIQRAYVIEDLSTDFLLGLDWIKRNGSKIDFEKNTLKIGNQTFELLIKEKQSSFSVSTSRQIQIEPLSSKIEWIKIPKDFDNEVIFESINDNTRQGLFKVYNQQIPLILINKQNYPVTIEKGKFLGNIESIEKVNIGSHIGINNIGPQIEEKASKLVEFDKNLTSEQRLKLSKLIEKYDKIFSKNERDIGRFKKFKFDIKTKNENPIKSRAYRTPYAQQKTVEKMVDEMLENKIITKSNSPWSSPIVIVKKKDGTDRFCVDYRKLNKETIKDNYPIPLIEETLDSLGGVKYFSTLDLTAGYWQIELSEEAKEKTAFTCHRGLFQFEVLPFGLSNAKMQNK